MSVETVEIIINTHFSYTHFNVTLRDRFVDLLNEDMDFGNPIYEDYRTDIYDELPVSLL